MYYISCNPPTGIWKPANNCGLKCADVCSPSVSAKSRSVLLDISRWLLPWGSSDWHSCLFDRSVRLIDRAALDRAAVLLKMSKEAGLRIDNLWGSGGGQRPVNQLIKEVRTFWDNRTAWPIYPKCIQSAETYLARDNTPISITPTASLDPHSCPKPHRVVKQSLAYVTKWIKWLNMYWGSR